MATAAKTTEQATEIRRDMRHMDGCPAAIDEELAAVRVETYRTAKPARQESRDGMTYSLPPQPMTVVHCTECGEMSYHKES